MNTADCSSAVSLAAGGEWTSTSNIQCRPDVSEVIHLRDKLNSTNTSENTDRSRNLKDGGEWVSLWTE